MASTGLRGGAEELQHHELGVRWQERGPQQGAGVVTEVFWRDWTMPSSGGKWP